MHGRGATLPTLLLLLSSCAATGGALPEAELRALAQEPAKPRWTSPNSGPRHWERGTVAMQGFFGAASMEDVTLDQDGADLEFEAEEFDLLPVIGGGGQWKFWGERVHWGLELMFSMSWRTNAIAFATGGGGAVVAVDVDTLMVDVFGGPFVNVFLGRDTRVYAGAGPTIQFLDYEQQDEFGNELDSTGLGFGWYARTGIEFLLLEDTWLGLGVRSSDARVDLGSQIGDFDVETLQAVITVTTAF